MEASFSRRLLQIRTVSPQNRTVSCGLLSGSSGHLPEQNKFCGSSIPTGCLSSGSRGEGSRAGKIPKVVADPDPLAQWFPTFCSVFFFFFGGGGDFLFFFWGEGFPLKLNKTMDVVFSSFPHGHWACDRRSFTWDDH